MCCTAHFCPHFGWQEHKYVRDWEIKEDSPLCSAVGPSVLQQRRCESLFASLGRLNRPVMGNKKIEWASALPLDPGGGCTLHLWKCNTTGVLLSLPSPPLCWASPRTELKLGREGSAPPGLLSTSRNEGSCSCWVSSFAACRAYTPLSMGALLPGSWLGLPKPVVHVPAVTQRLVLCSTCPAVSQRGKLGHGMLNGSHPDFPRNFPEIFNPLKLAFGLSKNEKLFVVHIKYVYSFNEPKYLISELLLNKIFQKMPTLEHFSFYIFQKFALEVFFFIIFQNF